MAKEATIGPFTHYTEREIGDRLTTVLSSLFPKEDIIPVVVKEIPEPDDPGGKPW